MTGDLAAVDVHDLAGDEGRRLQEEDGVDDVIDLADVPEWDEALPETGVALRGMRRRLNDAR